MSAKKLLVKHVTKSGGNVFADLGFSPSEAKRLKAQSDLLVREKLAMRTDLMRELSDWISSQDLRQAEAATILSVSRPRISEVVNLKSEKFSIDMLIDMLSRAGKQVVITVQDQPARKLSRREVLAQ